MSMTASSGLRWVHRERQIAKKIECPVVNDLGSVPVEARGVERRVPRVSVPDHELSTRRGARLLLDSDRVGALRILENLVLDPGLRDRGNLDRTAPWILARIELHDPFISAACGRALDATIIHDSGIDHA